jgi:hypothetical protein
MKTTKAPAFESAMHDDLAPMDETSTVVRIRGLHSIGGDTFRLDGIQPRNIEWQDLFRAIGEPDDGRVDERLAESINTAIRRHDFLTILTDRMSLN